MREQRGFGRGLLGWLDDRTGYRGLLRKALVESIPGGAKWRYVWGSTLLFAIAVQFVTGLVLWAGYSPNANGAWESVYYIENGMAGGWMLRGIHHYMAHATMVLLVLHLMQVVVAGAYKAPREVNFWFGLALLHIVMGLSLTGYLLPWDQQGYWATKVATSIASVTPVVGPALQKVLVGGAEYGHLTLTRFFALHAGVLPGALMVLIAGHVFLFRRHGITTDDGSDGAARERARKQRDGMFWPDQALRDAVACLAVMAAVLFLVIRAGGAPLGAPADPSEPFPAARPEWYFMFLFQWLKYFPAGTEVIGAIVIPGIVVTLIALMPLAGRWRLGHRFNLGLTAAVLGGIALLTWQAYTQDGADEEFVFAHNSAEAEADRVAELAAGPNGIPPGGCADAARGRPVDAGTTPVRRQVRQLSHLRWPRRHGQTRGGAPDGRRPQGVREPGVVDRAAGPRPRGDARILRRDRFRPRTDGADGAESGRRLRRRPPGAALQGGQGPVGAGGAVVSGRDGRGRPRRHRRGDRADLFRTDRLHGMPRVPGGRGGGAGSGAHRLRVEGVADRDHPRRFPRSFLRGA